MNYACGPDLDSSRDLTVDAVSLFQRFQQDADKKYVDALIERELAQYVKLCELAILYAAGATYYWCRLPSHPLQEIEVFGCRHLADMGFKIEYREAADERSVSSRNDREKRVPAVVVESFSTASWLFAKPLRKAAFLAEWRRREQLEDANLSTNPPRRQSRGSGKKIDPRAAVWAAILDGKYVVEIQRLHDRSFLCLFNLAGKCLHFEETSVAYGADFGPDVGDIAAWQERATQIVGALAGAMVIKNPSKNAVITRKKS